MAFFSKQRSQEDQRDGTNRKRWCPALLLWFKTELEIRRVYIDFGVWTLSKNHYEISKSNK